MAEPFSVEDETGFMVYSNMNYNSKSVNSFWNYQIDLINFCQDLTNLITNLKELTNLKEKYQFMTMDISPSITMIGRQVYNNIKIERGPERTVEEGQSWQIRWNTDRGQPQHMEFDRIYKSKQSLTIQAIQAAYDYAYTTYKEIEAVKIHDARVGARTLSAWDKVWENAGPAASAWAEVNAPWKRVADVVRNEAMTGARAAREAIRRMNFGDVVGIANAKEQEAEAEAEAAKASAPSRVAAVDKATALLAQALYESGGGNKIRKRTKGKKIKRKKRKKTKKTN